MTIRGFAWKLQIMDAWMEGIASLGEVANPPCRFLCLSSLGHVVVKDIVHS